MAESRISTRYASSFLGLALEKGIVERASTDMDMIFNAFSSSAELRSAMKNPVIKVDVKESVLTEIFSKKIDAETMKFVKFVLQKGREDLLQSIAQKFLELKDIQAGVVKIIVTSAFDLSEAQKKEIKDKFISSLNKKVEISYKIEKKVIGGFIAKIGDTIYDASVQHQLELLRKHFIKSGISLN